MGIDDVLLLFSGGVNFSLALYTVRNHRNTVYGRQIRKYIAKRSTEEAFRRKANGQFASTYIAPGTVRDVTKDNQVALVIYDEVPAEMSIEFVDKDWQRNYLAGEWDDTRPD